MVQIEIGNVVDATSTTEKGRILEHLVARLLKIQQYDVVETIRVTGMEIDVFAKHKISNEKIIVECKAWESPLPADVISKLLGNILLKGADKGWLVTTGPLSKDAKGIKTEWEQKEDADRKRLIFYTGERILDQLIAARYVVGIDTIRAQINNENISEDAVLLFTANDCYWIIPFLSNKYNAVERVCIFEAQKGTPIKQREKIDHIKRISKSYPDADWYNVIAERNKVDSKIKDEINSVVSVIGGDDWEDYRPARPQDFVGRKHIIREIMKYFESVKNRKTNTRIFSITAPSGMGKSSLILKIVSEAFPHRTRKSYFLYALDSRTAVSTRYVELALQSCINEAGEKGFIKKQDKKLEVSSIMQMLQSDVLRDVLEELETKGKIIVLIFDQFEELFAKKELFSVFEKIKQLSNMIDQLQGNFVVGFSWKTDLTLPADHPAYYMWSNLSDRRKEFSLSPFNVSEIKGALKIFSGQLGETINPVLRNYLTKQCQGYPWLLKKLCIHVFKLIKNGSNQDIVIGEKLNIVDLFERDINELTPDEHRCIREIAKDSPADYFDVTDLFGNDVVQNLINKRIIIRRASRLTLYWDIFRDYVMLGKVPNIFLDYVPQQQYATVAKLLGYLLDYGQLSIEGISIRANMKISTIENFLVDSVMFGVVKKENGVIVLTKNNKSDIFVTLRNFFRKHLVYIELKKRFLQEFDYDDYYLCCEQVFSTNSLADKTKRTYAAKLMNWFINLDMVEPQNNKFLLVNSSKRNELLSDKIIKRSNRNINSMSTKNLFWGATSPEILKKAYKEINDSKCGYKELCRLGYRNAVGILVSFGGVIQENKIYYVNNPIEIVMKRIKSTDTILFGEKLFNENRNISGEDMGDKLAKRFNKNWGQSSKRRYGNAIRKWVRYFLVND